MRIGYARVSTQDQNLDRQRQQAAKKHQEAVASASEDKTEIEDLP